MKLQDFDYRLWNKEAGFYAPIAVFEKSEEKSEFYSIPINDNNIYIELWTGFFDINGNKIFEGDIVKHLDTNLEYLVEFYNASFIISPLKYQHRLEFQLSISIFFLPYPKKL